MDFQVVFFDADDTLLDFKRSEEVSFKTVMRRSGFDEKVDELYKRYTVISRDLWTEYDKGNITKDFLRYERYKQLFEEFSLEGDYRGIAEQYLGELPNHTFFFDGAIEICKEIREHLPLAVITNGFIQTQTNRFAQIGLENHVDHIFISEEVGFQKPDVRIFEHALERVGCIDPKRAIIIGDRLETDIQGGINAGLVTCWFNPLKKENPTDILPDLEVSSLEDLLPICLSGIQSRQTR